MNINDLRELNLNELIKLRDKCNYLIQIKKDPNVQHSDQELWFYDTLKRIGKKEGVGYFPDLDQLKETRYKEFNGFHEKFQAFMEWVESSGFDETKKQWLFNLLGNILVRWIRTNPEIETFSYTTILRNIHNIPGLFENQFPEYIKSGLQNKILQ